MEELNLTKEWDKTFPKSSEVTHKKVTFITRFGVTIAADQYEPKNGKGKLSAIAVSGPFGAVKEQASGLYAQEMAKRGFLAIAFDPSFTGESGGNPRNIASPDINTEDYQAAVDYLCNLDNVDPERIGIIGICGFGGLALNAASLDTRIKATAAMTMYNMSDVTQTGYFHNEDNEKSRYEKRVALNKQRTIDFKKGEYASAGALPDKPFEGAPQFVVDYINYYRTSRGFHPRSQGCGKGWNVTGTMSFLNEPLLQYASEIRSAVLLVHGEKAHSLYMGKEAFAKLKGENKEFLLIPNAVHTDLYDRKEFIPFDKLEEFFRNNLK